MNTTEAKLAEVIGMIRAAKNLDSLCSIVNMQLRNAGEETIPAEFFTSDACNIWADAVPACLPIRRVLCAAENRAIELEAA